jgi:hypothetical protein
VSDPATAAAPRWAKLSDIHEPASRRLVGICGLAAFVLSAAIAAVPPPPPVGTAGAVVRDYYAAHGTRVLVFNFLGLVGLVPFLPVIAYTVALVRDREGTRGWLWLLILAAALFMCAAGFVALAVLQGAAYCAPDAGPELARALGDLASLWFGMFFVTVVAFMLALAGAVQRTRIWPAWIAWASLAVAAASLAASLGTVVTTGPLAAGGPVTLVAFLAFLIWLLAYSVLILARPPAGLPTHAANDVAGSTGTAPLGGSQP